MRNFIIKHQNYIIIITLSIVSVIFFYYYYSLGITTAIGDAMSRLNIARKIVDNLTPGFAQVGNVWLPLPQVLMVPFIWNSFLWHSGIAGSIMSSIMYILGGYYIFKTGKLITNNFWSSIFALSIYALNINMLYMQTTAMSEGVFICFEAIMMYYFIKWTKTNKLTDLVLVAVSVNGLTLTRYEGLSVLLASFVIVAIYSFIKYRDRFKTESDLIVFSCLAFFGFILWTLYLAAIFGDPLYWVHYYAAPQVIKTAHVVKATYAQNLSLLSALWKYLTAMIWMNGLIPIIYAILGVCILIYKNIRKISIDSLPLLVPFSVVLFMILTLQRNTPINQPVFNLTSILTTSTNFFNEFNIRYGLIMLPFVALFSIYTFSMKNIYLKLFIFSFFFIQLISYVYPKYSIIFQLPYNIEHAYSLRTGSPYDDVAWFQKHYDGGLIMVSALKHDPEMFKFGVNYSTYIHEGTNKYWKASIKDPSVYATWIWMDSNNADDQVTKYLKNSGVVKKAYTLVYSKNGVLIYKIKGKVRNPIST